MRHRNTTVCVTHPLLERIRATCLRRVSLDRRRCSGEPVGTTEGIALVVVGRHVLPTLQALLSPYRQRGPTPLPAANPVQVPRLPAEVRASIQRLPRAWPVTPGPTKDPVIAPKAGLLINKRRGEAHQQCFHGGNAHEGCLNPVDHAKPRHASASKRHQGQLTCGVTVRHVPPPQDPSRRAF